MRKKEINWKSNFVKADWQNLMMLKTSNKTVGGK